LPIETKLIDGDPATVLRDVSVDALHAVVGTRGASRLRLVWGSVAAELAETCPVPLAVIHSGRRSRSGPVVVGVDGTATSWPAIDYAFESAAARQTSLTAVHCWTNHSVGGCEPANGAGISSSSRRQVEGRQAARLTEELRRWAGRYPTVLVEKSIVHGQPGTELLHYATSAQLIVAGRRGSPGRSGMLLGSTGLTLIAHCRCPVVIVRAPAG
jgi:nucleotide-binding universal stress UspA family protein